MGKFSEAYLETLCFAIRSGAMDAETMKKMIKIYGDLIAAEQYDEMINGIVQTSEPKHKAAPVFNADLLGKKMRQANMPQKDLADALCVSRQAVSDWVNGKSQPSSEKLIALAALFDVEPSSFFLKAEDDT